MSRKIPDGWLETSNIGKPIPRTRFVAFKVPLRQSLCNNLKPNERFSPYQLLEKLPDLKLVIDLTNTNRYYDKKVFLDKGIVHEKILCPGKMVPSPWLVKQFFDVVDKFMKSANAKDKYIGVHCTHGINRTGYFICNYMVHKLRFKPQDAIDAFEEARGHKIIRHYLTQELKKHSNTPIDQWEDHFEPRVSYVSKRRNVYGNPRRNDMVPSTNRNIYTREGNRPFNKRTHAIANNYQEEHLDHSLLYAQDYEQPRFENRSSKNINKRRISNEEFSLKLPGSLPSVHPFTLPSNLPSATHTRISEQFSRFSNLPSIQQSETEIPDATSTTSKPSNEELNVDSVHSDSYSHYTNASSTSSSTEFNVHRATMVLANQLHVKLDDKNNVKLEDLPSVNMDSQRSYQAGEQYTQFSNHQSGVYSEKSRQYSNNSDVFYNTPKQSTSRYSGNISPPNQNDFRKSSNYPPQSQRYYKPDHNRLMVPLHKCNIQFPENPPPNCSGYSPKFSGSSFRRFSPMPKYHRRMQRSNDVHANSFNTVTTPHSANRFRPRNSYDNADQNSYYQQPNSSRFRWRKNN